MDKKIRPNNILPTQKPHFTSKDTCRLKVKGRKIMFQANGNQKQALVSDKRDFKTKIVRRNKE
jgi:hypothetical protein